MRGVRWLQAVMLAGGVAVGSGSATAMAESGWSRVGTSFDGSPVSAIVSDSNDDQGLAAIVQGQLYMSSTAGTVWQAIATPGPVTAVAFDSAYRGRIWVGMAAGGCVARLDAGETVWKRYGSGCYVTAIAPTVEGVYLLDSSSSTDRILATVSDGSVVALPYSGEKPYLLTATPDGQKVFVAGDRTMMIGSEAGRVWRPTTSVGCCIAEIAVNDEGLWQLASGRPYRSVDQGLTWTPIGPEAASGYGVGRLMVRGQTPYFAMSNPNNDLSDVVTQATTPIAGLGLGRFPNGLTVADGWLYAATSDGIWRYGTRLPNLARRLRPVVVIPGIGGSWPQQNGVRGPLVLDPILHTYDGLLAKLRAVGYSEAEGSLVPFPYQWRQDNAATAAQLAQVIATTKRRCGCDKVDIVAHSMGGLVAREYIEGEAYHNDVARLVEIATPNRGSPLAYPVWEAGRLSADNFDVMQGAMAQLLIELVRVEGLLKHYASVTDYIRDGLPSVGQLLPDTTYLHGRTYPIDHPPNYFLEALNAQSAIQRLRQRVGLYIVGSKSKPTITGLDVTAPSGHHLWPDGEIIGRQMGDGDGTVSYASLDGLGQVNASFDADHGGVVEESADAVITYLLGEAPDATYKATVPNQPALEAAVGGAWRVTKPKRAVAIVAKSSARLTVVAANLPAGAQLQRFVDEVTDTVVVTYPGSEGESDVASIVVAAGPSEPTPIEVITASDDLSRPPISAAINVSPGGPSQYDVEVTAVKASIRLQLHEVTNGLGVGNIKVGTASKTLAAQARASLNSLALSAMKPHLSAAVIRGGPSSKQWYQPMRGHPETPIVAGIGLILGGCLWWLLILFWRRLKRAGRTSGQA